MSSSEGKRIFNHSLVKKKAAFIIQLQQNFRVYALWKQNYASCNCRGRKPMTKLPNIGLMRTCFLIHRWQFVLWFDNAEAGR